jgi:hypothetical protein
VGESLARLACDLAALADDMRAAPESADWLLSEYKHTIERLPHTFDRAGARTKAEDILGRISARHPHVDSRDLFLVYVPEDRIPVAAPLAIELTKRRISIAFSEYEVESQGQLEAAIRHGLEYHRGGVVLCTKSFERAQWDIPGTPDRLRIVRAFAPSLTDELSDWARLLH